MTLRFQGRSHDALPDDMAVLITDRVEASARADTIRGVAAEQRALASCDELIPEDFEGDRRGFLAVHPQQIDHLTVRPDQTLPAPRHPVHDRLHRVFETPRVWEPVDHEAVQDLLGIEHLDVSLRYPILGAGAHCHQLLADGCAVRRCGDHDGPLAGDQSLPDEAGDRAGE